MACCRRNAFGSGAKCSVNWTQSLAAPALIQQGRFSNPGLGLFASSVALPSGCGNIPVWALGGPVGERERRNACWEAYKCTCAWLAPST